MDALTVLRREIVSGVVLVAVLVVVRAMQRARLMVAGKVALGSREGGKETTPVDLETPGDGV